MGELALPSRGAPWPAESYLLPPTQMQQESQEPEEPSLGGTEVKLQAAQQKASSSLNCPDTMAVAPAGSSPPVKDRLKATSAGACAR